MTAVVASGSLGLLNSSLLVLGGQGAIGSAPQGRAGEQVYVNAANGNLYIQGQDELLIGRGPDGAVLRSYNSQGQIAGETDNWRLGIYRNVHGLTGTANTAGATVKRTDADGSESVYTYDAASGKYVTSEGTGAFDTLQYSAGVWTWTDGDSQVAETYDDANGGRLTAITDPSGNAITFTYVSGKLTQVNTASGEVTYLDYTGDNLTQVRTVTGGSTTIRTSYAYDASNRLVQVSTDLTPENSVDSQFYLTNYTYDGTGRRVATMTQSDGTSLAFAYTLVGSDYRVSQITDALGRVTAFSYNTTTRVTSVTDALGLVTQFAYDTSGRLTSLTAPAAGGASQVVSYAYDGSGNVTQVTDARGNAVVYQYDGSGNRVYERDAAGNTVQRVFGAKNELLAETVYQVPDPDGAGAAQPSSPLTTRYVYDSSSRLRYVVSAQGRVTEHRYDGYGQRTASIQYTAQSYDVSALTPTSTLTESQLNAWLPANRSATIRVDSAYDFRGQMASVTAYAAVDSSGNGIADGTQSVTQYVYDQAGKLLKTIDARGTPTPDPNDFTTSYVYDGMGRLLSTTNALGQVTLTQYDDANRKTTLTLANGLVRTSTYSAAGELVSVLESASSQALGETKYFYDADGRLRRTEDPTGVKTHLLYDEAGRRIGEIDGDGSLTEHRYDANNNLTRSIRYANAVSAANLASLIGAGGAPASVALSAIRPAASGSDRSTWNAYDSANRLVKSVDAAGFVTQYTYDGASRLTDVLRFANAISTASLGDAPAASSISPTPSATADRPARNFHDAEGRLLAALDGEGYLVEHKYDSARQLAETVAYASAANAGSTLDAVRPTASGSDIHSYVLYNARGQATATVDGAGYLTESVYDLAGNKTLQVRYANAVTYTAGATLASLRSAASVPAQDRAASFTYDALDRVVSETNAEGTVTTYAYDSAGKLVSTVRAASTAEARTLNAQYDKQGRLIAELGGEGSALITGVQTQQEIDAIWAQWGVKHAYDAAGRRVSTTDQYGAKTRFYYDADGRLSHAINALGEVQESVYDKLGQLVQTVKYGTRIAAATLATLTGGVADSTLAAALAGIANAALDSKVNFSYALTGRLAQSADALGNTTSQTYNAFGEAVTRSQQIGAGQTLEHAYAYDRRGLLTQTAWDPAGINALAATQYDAFGRSTQTTDANGNVRTSGYDKVGRVVSVTDPTNVTRSTTYDAHSRVLTQTDGLGNVTSYTYNTTARSVTVTTPEGVAITTARTRHGETLTVTDGRGGVTTHAYDRNGNLVSVTDAASQVSTRGYDRAGRLVETVDAAGNRVALAYDAASRILSRRVDPAGLNLTTTYTYDAKGQAVTVTGPDGVVTQTAYDLKGQAATVTVDPAGLNLKTAFTYDARGLRLTVTEGADTAAARVTQYQYDKLGRRISERLDPSGLNLTTTYAYDKNGNVATRTDASANVTRYYYDGNDRLLVTLDPLNGVSRNFYDAEDRVTQTIAYANAASGLPASPTLAQVLVAIQADAARDAATRSVYDKDGRLVYAIDASWGVTKNVHDASGNVIERLVYATPISSATALTVAGVAAALSTNAADRRTRVVYDALDRAQYTIDALGAVVQNWYDGNGNVVRAVGYANAVALAGQPSAAQVAAALTPNAAADRNTRQVYDAAGRLAFAIDALGYVKEVRYDAAGRISSTIQYAQSIAVGATPTYAQVAAALQGLPATNANQVNSFSHDAAGRLVESTDAEGFTETFAYDALGSKLAFTNKKGAIWTYFYDAAGRLTREVSPAVEVTTVSESLVATSVTTPIETHIAYDALGNVTSRTEAYGLTGERTTTYVYDALGRQVRTNFPQVGVYNATGDDLTTNGISGTVTRTETTQSLYSTVAYNALGQAVVSLDAAGNTSYKVYDALGRVKYEIDAERYLTEYRYDTFGGRTQVLRYATAISFALHTDPAAPFTAAEVAGLIVASAEDRVLVTSYDLLGRAAEVVEPSAYHYDSSAAAGSQSFTAGATTKNVYDAFGNVVKQSTLKNPLTNQWVDTYSYYDVRGKKSAQIDALGYLTKWEYDETGDVVRQLEYAAALGAGTWSLAGYPALPATTTPANAPGSAIGYDRETTYAYDRQNRKIAETRVNVEYAQVTGTLGLGTTSGNLATTYGYDAVGNLVRMTDAAGASTYTYYDALGRVTAIAEPSRVSDSASAAVVMPPVHVSYASGTNAVTLSFAKQTSADTVVGFRYAVAGTTNWVSATPQAQGTNWVVALTGATSDRYIYEITYTKAGDSVVYATGSGGVNVLGPTSAGSANVAATVEQPSVNGSIAASAHFDQVSDGEGGYTQAWNGYSQVNLSWNSLDALGSGNVRVRVNYATYRNDPGDVLTANGTNTYREQTFTAAQAATGATLSWTESWPVTYAYVGVRVINSIQVWKIVDAQEILVHSAAPGTTGSERLLLRGNTAGLTGVNVTGVGTLAATSLGAGVYAVDLGTLSRKSYQFTPVGTSSAQGGPFDVTKTSVAGTATIQEINGGTTSAVLNAVNLPASAAQAVLEYRLAGDTGPYLSKTLNGGSGNFTIAYDDVANGAYEFVLTVRDASNNLVDLTTVGGTAAGTLSGTLQVLRGGQSLPVVVRNSSALEVTPLATIHHDAHGNAVRTTRHAKGTTGADTLGYGTPTGDAADQVSHSFFDLHGHVVRSVDAEGASKYSSYDAMGRAVKVWQPFTTNDGLVQNAVQVFQYDKLGRQTATIEPSFLPTQTLATSAIQQTMQQQSAGFSLAASGVWSGSYWTTSTVNVSWSEMASWGGGNVYVRIYYYQKVATSDGEGGYTYSAGALTSRDFEIGNTATGTSFSWSNDSAWSVQRVVIWKRDAGNTLVQLHDRTSQGAYANRLHFAAPQQPGTTVVFKYKLTSASTWTTGTLYNFGSKYVADTIGLAAGTYDYEILYTRPGETNPSSASRGTFTLSGATGSLTNGGTATSWTLPALNPASYARTQAQYNAFGEIVAKGLNDGWQEYYDYDNAGRLWRTNDKDGVAKVYLHDTQGRVTAEILSPSLNLATYASAQDVAALTSGVRRTQTTYDLLGRAAVRTEQSFQVPSLLDSIPAALAMPQMSMSYSVAQVGYLAGDEESGYYWVPNIVNVGWNEMASWGGGNVYVRVSYRNTAGTFTSRDFEIGNAATGTSVSWTGDSIWYLTGVNVWKRDAASNLVLLHTASGATGHSIVWDVAPLVGTQTVLKYKATSSGTWLTATLNKFSAKYQFDTRGLAAGTYDYEILYTASGESQPYAHKVGTFTVGVGAGTTDTTATVLETIAPVMSQSADRWGNAVSVTDARGGLSSYRYDQLGNMVQETRPQVDVWAANGTSSLAAPIVRNYYDGLARAVGTVDANGNANTARYDAGGQLIAEYHADGGAAYANFDVLGRRTRAVDALGNATDYTYDRVDRLTKEKRPIGEDNYAYDELGNRKSSTDALGRTTYYWFDTRGKVVRTKRPGGQELNAYYDLRGNKVKEVNGNNDVATWGYDYFGKTTAHTDLGGATYTYAYDFTGMLTAQSNSRGMNQTLSYYENGALKQLNDVALNTQTFYQYDAAGNRTREKFIKAGTLHLDNRITYDLQNRMTKVADNRYTIVYGYDANGNRRKAVSDYFDNSNNPKHVENWYLYDAMNRIVLSQGVLNAGQIQIGTTQGVALQYDANGNRRVATKYEGGSQVAESYNYDANNRLTTTNRGGALTSSRAYDAAGQVTQTISYSSPGTINERRESTYNVNGQLTQQDVFNSASTLTQRTIYTGYDGAGNVASYQSSVYTGTAYTNYYGYEYAKYDGYKEKKVNGSSSYFLPGSTTVSFDVNGNTVSVSETFATNKNRSFLTTTPGQILQKTENGQTQYYFYANDKPIGSSGALGSADFDYNYTPVSAQYPAATPGSYVVSQGDTLTSISLAVFGDAQLWYIIADANGLNGNGDLRVGQQLTIPNKITNLHNNHQTFKVYNPSEIIGDTTPTLPDPPPPPEAGGKRGCGGIGQILVIVVTIIVAIYAAYALEGVVGAAEAAVVGAGAGNVAGQVTANAVGIQDGFSFESLATSVLSAGITHGIADKLSLSGTAGFNSATAGRAAIASTVNQGLNIVVGRQDKFDWRGVAAAAIAAPIAAGISNSISGAAEFDGTRIPGVEPSEIDFGSRFAGGLAGGTAAAVVRMAVYGGGRMNFSSVAADTFGNALGYALMPRDGSQQRASGSVLLADSGAATRSDALSPTEEAFLLAQSDGASRRLRLGFDPADDSQNLETLLETPLGSGLRVTPQQAAEFGPRFASELDFSVSSVTDFGLVPEGASVRLPLSAGAASARPTINSLDVVLGVAAGAGELVLDTVVGGFVAAGTIVGAGLDRRLRPFGIELFSSHTENLNRAFAGAVEFVSNDALARTRLALTDRFEAIDLAVQAGDGFQAARLSTNLAGETVLAATGVGGAFRGGIRLLGASGRSLVSAFDRLGTGPVFGSPAAQIGAVGDLRNARFVDFSTGESILPGFYRADPRQLRFSQPDVSPNFIDPITRRPIGTIDSLVADLRASRVTVDEVGNPLQVVIHEGRPFSIDHRRLVAYNLAEVRNVPIQVVSLKDPIVKGRFFDRFDPIRGEGLNIVVTPRAGRAAVQTLLRDRGLIKGVQLGR